MSTIVLDPFTRADNAATLGTAPTTGQVWTVPTVGATFGITGNKAAQTGLLGSGTWSIAALPTTANDRTVSVNISTSGFAALVFRITDDNNYWLYISTAGQLYKKVAGSFVLIQGGLATGTGVYAAILQGNFITIQKDGVDITHVTDSFNATAAMDGFGCLGDGTMRFDDFTVTTLAILATDANLVYSPYNWDRSGAKALSGNSGAYIRAFISGNPTSIVLNFDVSGLLGNLPQLWYRLDDGPWSKVTMASAIPLTMSASANSWTKHNLEVVIKGITIGQSRYSTPAAQVQFRGMTIMPDGCTALAVTKRALQVVVFGDSITEGCQTMKTGVFTPELDGFDSQQAYAWQLTNALGAEIGVVGWSGQGWITAGSGAVPAFSATWSQINSATSRDLTTSPPDLIVINQGQNDGAGATVSTITAVINLMLAATPGTTLIAVLRPFGGNQAANIQAGLAAVSQPGRVKYIDTTGWLDPADTGDGIHPWGYMGVFTLAPLLAAALRTFLRRGTSYVNVGGTAKPVSGVRL